MVDIRANSERLKKQFEDLYSQTIAQRSLRLGLRAFWLIIAGTLLGWGVHALWGWLPNALSWFLIGLLFGLAPLLGILSALIPEGQWVWMLDRQLGLKEQLSTAWEVARRDRPGALDNALMADVSALLPAIRAQVLKAGWVRRLDVISSLAVMFLAFLLLVSALFPPPPAPQVNSPPPQIPQTAPQPLPPSPAPPGAEPSKAPSQPAQNGDSGQEGNASPENGPAHNDPNGQNSQPSDPSSASSSPTDKILRELGSQLSSQAGTYDLGKALENLDLNGAADALQDLTGQLDDLSPETKQNLSQAFGGAAGALDQAGEKGLANDMGSAAGELADDQGQAEGPLGQVANDLRQLAQGQSAPGVAGAGTGPGSDPGTGSPEPLTRLREEGGQFDLPLDDPVDPSTLLNPAPADAAGQEVATGSLDSASSSVSDVIQGPLLPNSFLWKWRDVVSQYFQHR